jgi:hypothetical protein
LSGFDFSTLEKVGVEGKYKKKIPTSTCSKTVFSDIKIFLIHDLIKWEIHLKVLKLG